MVDRPGPISDPVVTAPVVVTEPVVVAPVVVPPAVPEPAAVVAPVVTAEPAKTEAPAAGTLPAADATPADPLAVKPSILSGDVKPDSVKPADGTPGTEPPVVEAVVEAKPVYEPFKLPEGAKLDAPLMEKFTDLLGANKLSQEIGQALIDQHLSVMQTAMAAQAQAQAADNVKAYNDMRSGWVDEIKSDPKIGGNRLDTHLVRSRKMIEQFVPVDQRAAFDQALNVTGMGDHPAFHRMLATIADWFDEPAMPANPTKPPANSGKNPNAKKGLRSIYKDNASH